MLIPVVASMLDTTHCQSCHSSSRFRFHYAALVYLKFRSTLFVVERIRALDFKFKAQGELVLWAIKFTRQCPGRLVYKYDSKESRKGPGKTSEDIKEDVTCTIVVSAHPWTHGGLKS